MKNLYKSILLLTIFGFLVAGAYSQTVIKINSNTTWSASEKEPFQYGQCINCIIEIAPGATLTLTKSLAFTKTIFKGGKLDVVNVQTNIYNGGTTEFNDIDVTFKANAVLMGSGPVSSRNAKFTFENNSKLVGQYSLDFDNSSLKFNGNSKFEFTGSVVNLKNNTNLMIGDGSNGSNAMFWMNGQRLNIYNGSKIGIATNYNKYKSWGSFYVMPEGRFVNTLSNNMNCGSGQPNACAMDEVYGPLMFDETGIAALSSLPVKLSDFSVNADKQQVIIRWTTSQEQQSDRFVIQRSNNNNSWSDLGNVKAAGNSQLALNYYFNDKNPLAGQAYYRLKMIDTDGTTVYSEIRQITPAAKSSIKVFPNPTADFVQINTPDMKGNSKIQLLNANGQILKEVMSSNNQITTIAVAQYNSGSYFIRVADNSGNSESFRLMIRK